MNDSQVTGLPPTLEEYLARVVTPTLERQKAQQAVAVKFEAAYLRALADNLRTWLEWYPERVMFGTDLYPGSGEIDWEEIGWITTHDARQGLTVALTSMMKDGLMSRERASEVAHMVLHDNAARQYGLPSK